MDTPPDSPIVSIPEFAMVVLIGASGSGKSTFAKQHFLPTEILSSDTFRAMIADDEADQSASAGAFALLHLALNERLSRHRLTVIDATNVRQEARKPLMEIAYRHHATAVAIVLDVPIKECHARNQSRPGRNFGIGVLRGHADGLRRSRAHLEKEGFRRVVSLEGTEAIAAATVVRTPLPIDKKLESGPFDIVGDVHGCYPELCELLTNLGYTFSDAHNATPPAGRKLVFVGDLVDRGPDSPGVLKLMLNMGAAGNAFCVMGNHDDKFLRYLRGSQVSIAHGLARTIEQLDADEPHWRDAYLNMLNALPSHLLLDGGKLVVAHAGLPEELHGRMSGRVRSFALYGDTTGETDADGYPVRGDWAANYRGRSTVVYGHTVVAAAEWINRTICLDTGCVFGGRLTALRYPEMELVSIGAKEEYFAPKIPFEVLAQQSRRPALPAEIAPTTGQQLADTLLDFADVMTRRSVSTRLAGRVKVPEGQAAAALELLTRFAADPRWLIYLPPTMAPAEASSLPSILEHPAEAFEYFRREGIDQVVCEQKHMGSRAVAIVCRTDDAAQNRFGIRGEGGIVLTRSGRAFFDQPSQQREFLDHIRTALSAADWWATHNSEWFAFDGELMPWSAKAQELLRKQYAATAAAGKVALAHTTAALASCPHDGAAALHTRFAAAEHDVMQFTEAYRRYCWPVNSISDLKFAPFALLASEGKVWAGEPHDAQMQLLGSLAAVGQPLLFATPHRMVNLNDTTAIADATAWWETLTASGGEGMVVKPLTAVARNRRGQLVQPALKVRGAEYLRLIYGPSYLRNENLDRLRHRSVGTKRGLAAREFALGLEALERFTRREPLRQVHECIFALLALEAEPIDPRL